MGHRPDSGGRRRTHLAGLVAIMVCAAAVQCSRPSQPSPTGPSGPTVPNGPNIPLPSPNVSAVFVGAGDIGWCPGASDRTASLIDNIGGSVFTLGDNAYPNGARADFDNCYERTWGRHRGRTYPSPGNHDYNTPQAAGYFDYFGDIAGASRTGYYSFDLGAWHVVSLNSNFEAGVDVRAGSAQAGWLRTDLMASPRRCTLAFWHHPLFSSGANGSTRPMRDLFAILYELNADIVLTGHDHDYENFGPQNADGQRDTVRGIRQFVVGTGGIALTPFRTRLPNSEQQISDTHGVLKLTLNPENAQYEFVTPVGVRDSGTVTCH